MSTTTYQTAITELEAYIKKIQGKKITKEGITLCAGHHVALMTLLERNRVVKNINYYIRYVAKCEASDSDKIIQYFKDKGYFENKYSKSRQPEIIVLA